MKKKNKIRLIPRLDIKGINLVKGINLEGFRALGDANFYVEKYYKENADEIILNDVVASLYEKNTLNHFIKKISKKIFIPLIVGGGVKTLEEIEFLLKSGADRIFLNSSIIKKPKFLNSAVKYFGSSTIIASIEVVKINNKYFCVSNSGREKSNLNLIKWAQEIESRGASEILLTSVDNDGLGNGFDTDLINILKNKINIPFIISGGYGKLEHIKKNFKKSNLSGISIASALHYSAKNDMKIDLKSYREGNFEFLLKNISYKNFENTNINEIKRYLSKLR